jgi:hypothetical protein
MKRKYTNKYHLRPWVVKSVLVTDCIIDGITETVKFIGGIVFPAFLLGTSLGGIAVALLKLTGVIA